MYGLDDLLRAESLVGLYVGRVGYYLVTVRLHTACDYNVCTACKNLPSCVVDRVDCRSTLHFNEGCRGFEGKACCHSDVTGRSPSLGGCSGRSAHYRVYLTATLDDAGLRDQCLYNLGCKIGRGNGFDGTAHFTKGCTHTVYKYYFTHFFILL